MSHVDLRTCCRGPPWRGAGAESRATRGAAVPPAADRLAMDLLTSIGLSIIVAAALALVAHRLGQPLIIGYIVAGAVLGPHVGLNVIHNEHSIELIAQIGLILLLFLIGLELS